ncbi:uncharacterized protein BDW47DRAFT_38117 [Aspergillus candidus]|uniref:Uncharacterized protein n=1 Tax=Aspergillus candidus TaxID=41067 RepID=A0A2I2F9Y6_ASPCN|nr:hypothetical protein BDW47DRAFT_38117 [Aspergillus candidus]PLB37443.1 hypothetical protein BDW47DRAFT_38117 [Aspergillus candidus]
MGKVGDPVLLAPLGLSTLRPCPGSRFQEDNAENPGREGREEEKRKGNWGGGGERTGNQIGHFPSKKVKIKS